MAFTGFREYVFRLSEMARKKPATEERNCESRLLVRLLLVGSETSAPG